MTSELAGVGDRACRRVAVRQHHAVHLIGAERIDRDRRAERGIDAAGNAEQHAGKAVLADVVAQAEHAGRVVGLVALGLLGDRPGAAPVVAVPGEPQRGDALLERRQLRSEREIAVERERRAVEHQLVLAADLVEIDQRQAAFGDPRHRHRQPHVVLVAGIGRAVRHQNDLGAGLGQRLDHVLVVLGLFQPDVLADRHADPHAAHGDGARGRSARKQPLLVEHAVVRQVALEAQARRCGRRRAARRHCRACRPRPRACRPASPARHRRSRARALRSRRGRRPGTPASAPGPPADSRR